VILLTATLLALAAARAGDVPMSATTPVPARHASVLEEVIVTARRREERLQQVPISASVLSSQELRRLQVDEVATLQFVTPNLSIAPSQNTGTSASIALRGQFESDTVPTVDPAVGLYLDGVYLGRMSGANLRLVDLERVEVLRGPQGTLFGRNTIGGAINLVSQPPQPAFAASLATRLGNYDLRELTGVLNVPFLDGRLSTRLTGMHSEHGGYARNVLLDTELGNDDTNFARLQLQLALAPRVRVDFAGDYSHLETASQMRALLAVAPAAVPMTAALGNSGDRLENYVDPVGRRVLANRAGFVNSTVWGAGGTLAIELAALTFKSITAYRALDIRSTDSDQDATPYDLGVVLDRNDEQHQFSQELQAYGDALDDRLQWIGGLHYFDERAIFNQRYRIFVPAAAMFAENLPWGEASNHSLAAYAQGSFALTPALRLTAGARYNEDRRQLTSRNAQRVAGNDVCRIAPELRDEVALCVATRPERSFSYTPFTVGMEFDPVRGMMLYAKFSQGYRAGGYNLRGTNEIDMDTFKPEQVDSYEAGVKADLADEAIRVNLALFRSRFVDAQLVQREGIPGTPATVRVIRNGGEARIDGGELELTALLDHARIAAGIGVTRPRFTKLDPRVVGVTLDSSFPSIPERTASIAVDVPLAVRFGELNFHADYSWRDDIAFDYDPTSEARQEAYGLVNAMLSAGFDRAGLELSLWARNLADQSYVTRAFDFDYYVSGVPGEPRTYGVSLAYRFNR